MRLAGIAVACATVEEKVGSEEETGPSRAGFLKLALRLLSVWIQEHGRTHTPTGCRCARYDRSIIKAEKMEADISLYAAALSANGSR